MKKKRRKKKLSNVPTSSTFASIHSLYFDLNFSRFSPLNNFSFEITHKYIFSYFKCYSITQVETVGDKYMAVSGLPEVCDNHAKCIARLALDMMDMCKNVNMGPKPVVSIYNLTIYHPTTLWFNNCLKKILWSVFAVMLISFRNFTNPIKVVLQALQFGWKLH